MTLQKYGALTSWNIFFLEFWHTRLVILKNFNLPTPWNLSLISSTGSRVTILFSWKSQLLISRSCKWLYIGIYILRRHYFFFYSRRDTSQIHKTQTQIGQGIDFWEFRQNLKQNFFLFISDEGTRKAREIEKIKISL